MAENEVIGIGIEAKLEAFRQDMASIPGIGAKEAKALAAQLSQEIKATEKASKAAEKAALEAAKAQKEAAKATADATKGTKGLADRMDAADKGAKKLSGTLSLISPELGAMAQGVGDIVDVAEGFGSVTEATAGMGSVIIAAAAAVSVALAGTAAAVAVLGNAMTDDARLSLASAAAYVEMDRAAGHLAGTLDTLSRAHAATQAAMVDAAEQINLLTGATTSYEVAAVKAGRGVREAAAQELDVLRERLRLQMSGLNAAQAVLRADETTAEQKARATRQEAEYQSQIAATRLAINTLKRATSEQASALEGLILKEGFEREQNEKSTKSTRAATAATDGSAAATAAATKAEADRAAAVATLTEQLGRYEAALSGLRQIEEGAGEDRLSELDRLTAARDAALAEITSKEKAALDARLGDAAAVAELDAEVAAARLAVEERYRRDVAALEDKAADENAKRREAEAKAEETAAAARRSIQERLLGYARDGLAQVASGLDEAATAAGARAEALAGRLVTLDGYITESQRAELKKRIEASTAAARRSFEVSKIARLAEATVNTFTGATAALASAPPPFNFVAAGLVTSAGLANVAQIAAQQPAFHSGGPVDLQPDEGLRKVRNREYVSNPTGRAVLGDSVLRRANAGIAPSSGAVVVQVYRHTRQVDRYEADRLSAGNPIARALLGKKKPGME